MYQSIPAVLIPPPPALPGQPWASGSYLVPMGRAIARILVPGSGDMDCLTHASKYDL